MSSATPADDEDDYMSMIIPDPKAKKAETSIQRRARKQRENEQRARPKSKKELEAEKEKAREAALNTAIDTSNKGFKMMAKLGFKPGDTLGRSEGARKEPIRISVKDDRGGIGMESEKKRKIREAAEAAESNAKRTKVDEGDYRERMRLEREERKYFGQLKGAQQVAEKLDVELELKSWKDADVSQAQSVSIQNRSLRSINVLYRSLENDRRRKERDRERRAELQNRLSSLHAESDTDEDDDDRMALGKTRTLSSTVAEDLDEDDHELEQFESLSLSERLQKVVNHLREKHNYCFWCKFEYPDDSMEGCPGTAEDDHD